MPATVTTPISMDLLRGACELEPTAHGLLPHRLPGRFPDDIPEGDIDGADRHDRQPLAAIGKRRSPELIP